MNSLVPRMRASAKGGESGRLGADHFTSERWWGGGGEFGIGMNIYIYIFSSPFVHKVFFSQAQDMCVHDFFSLYNILHEIFSMRKRYSQQKKVVAYGKWSLTRSGRKVRVDCHGTWMSASIDKVE